MPYDPTRGSRSDFPFSRPGWTTLCLTIMKLCYFSAHHLIVVGNNVIRIRVIDHPNFIFSYAPKKLTALVLSVTVRVTYRQTSI